MKSTTIAAVVAGTGLALFLLAVGLSFFVSGGGLIALGVMGMALLLLSPFAGMLHSDLTKY